MAASDMDYAAAAALSEDPPGSDNEGFETVRPGKRRRGNSGSPNTISAGKDTQYKILLIPILSNKSLATVSPLTIAREIDAIAGGRVAGVRKAGRMLEIRALNERQLNKLTEATQLGGVDIKAEPPRPKFQKGVIVGVDKSLSDDAIQEALADQKVTATKRIHKREKGVAVKTTAICLTFDTQELPKFIYLGYEKKGVSVIVGHI